MGVSWGGVDEGAPAHHHSPLPPHQCQPAPGHQGRAARRCPVANDGARRDTQADLLLGDTTE